MKKLIITMPDDCMMVTLSVIGFNRADDGYNVSASQHVVTLNDRDSVSLKMTRIDQDNTKWKENTNGKRRKDDE